MGNTELLLMLSPIIIIQVALQIYALWDIRQRGGVKDGRTVLWVAIVALCQFPGLVAYFVLARKEEEVEEL